MTRQQEPLRFVRLTSDSESLDKALLDRECADEEERQYVERYLRLADVALHHSLATVLIASEEDEIAA